MRVDIDRIPVGAVTQIRLTSDFHTWVQSPFSAQAPVFVPPSGLLITTQQILDDHTALLSVNPSSPNSLVTLVDTLNKEAVTLKCWAAAQFAAMGETPQSDDQTPPTTSDNPIDDGYWSQTGTFSGGGGLI